MKAINIRKTCKQDDCTFDRGATWRVKDDLVHGDNLEEFVENQKRTFANHEYQNGHGCEYSYSVQDLG